MLVEEKSPRKWSFFWFCWLKRKVRGYGYFFLLVEGKSLVWLCWLARKVCRYSKVISVLLLVFEKSSVDLVILMVLLVG
jgi:hypothetical protein